MHDDMKKVLGVDENKEQKSTFKPLRAFVAGLSLSVVAGACCALVMFVDNSTKDVIAQNESHSIKARINDLLPPEAKVTGHTITCYNVRKDPHIGHNQKLFVSSKDNEILGYVLTYQTSQGYSNPLVMIAGFNSDKSVYKADIHYSLETPGLGDKVDRDHGNFLDQFNGETLHSHAWEVKKYGGDFDYITGATITSRATVIATYNALEALNSIQIHTLSKCKVH
ncbi:MAG: RnfABCDGE type electron transport complex subunit G [Succinivibrio sp.]|nr:RnfABCDGE type electron transport complex subunit G [Succinivibrio sp.]MCI7772814.1 RnfABCDGE type electron transport complex subunit G [Succinivibrio sp.]MCI7785195.1 RnfABCDGE type electron transport complex subunit G [Succinivibrio sp.]MDD7286411.1 RnfABCDGE type electron transport complex subunit G [Succinivibrio sp.]MDY5189001.1 RnfABCDGE type electron transport complex subunit G [Succinivibrio sp.]